MCSLMTADAGHFQLNMMSVEDFVVHVKPMSVLLLYVFTNSLDTTLNLDSFKTPFLNYSVMKS